MFYKKLFLILTLFLSVSFLLFGVPYFEEGEELFLDNKPEEARIMFENALEVEPENEKIYLYLGIVYEQLGMNKEAIEVMKKGLGHSNKLRDMLLYNIGNNYLKEEAYSEAIEMYTKAIEEKQDFSAAFLNRANVRVKTEDYRQAIADYRLYLELEPGSKQRKSIERMIATLKGILEEETRRIEEERRKAEEEARRKAEEERKRREEEERRRKEEEARQKALLDSVLKSLESASNETTNLSAESEDVEDVDEELDIAE